MNDLRNFVALQARLYEFLEQQDETTLQAIVSGQARLTVLDANDTRTPAPGPAPLDLTMAPSHKPVRAAEELAKAASEQERRAYLKATRFRKRELQEVAKQRRLSGYSKLTLDKLVDLLVSHGTGVTETLTDGPTNPMPSSSEPFDGSSHTEEQTTARGGQSSNAAPSARTTEPNADVAAIASRLRELETEEEGAAYLHTQHLDRESLLAVAAELQLTRVNRLSQTELEKRVLKQAIGSRRKFSGLRKW